MQEKDRMAAHFHIQSNNVPKEKQYLTADC